MLDEKDLQQKLDDWDALRKYYTNELEEDAQAQLFSEFDELLQAYISTDDIEREKMRDLFKEHRESRDLLFLYWNYQAENIRSKDDEDKLRLGLAAISLEDFIFDWRDSLVGLSLLYMSATEAGIDADPIYKEIGEISNMKVDKHGGSSSKTISRAPKSGMHQGDHWMMDHLNKIRSAYKK